VTSEKKKHVKTRVFSYETTSKQEFTNATPAKSTVKVSQSVLRDQLPQQQAIKYHENNSGTNSKNAF